MRTALRRLLQGLLVLALIPFLLDVPAGADASAESLLATGAAPNATVVSVEGRRTVVATAGSSSDPALVLIHGFGGSTFGWRHVMEPLAASGWYVVALDLPGFGLAEKGWGGAYDHASHARFVLAAMDQMQINQAVLAGHSMGGNVVSCSRLAARRAARRPTLGVVTRLHIRGSSLALRRTSRRTQS